MDNLQYSFEERFYNNLEKELSFKPYYKWITFNTSFTCDSMHSSFVFSFKPYYKWITFNTQLESSYDIMSDD